jgi:hypothetical protein
MFFSSFFSSFGGSLGQMFGGGILGTIGRMAGGFLGRYLDEKSHSPEQYFYYKRQLDNLFLHSHALNKTIPIVFGRARIYGQLIWSTPIIERPNVSCLSQYFEFSGAKKSERITTEYCYYANIAVAICQGPIERIDKVWAQDKLIDIHSYKHRLYLGSAQQMPDALIMSHQGEFTPAFRDLAYIVFEDMALSDFDNQVPLLSFEVTRKAQSPVAKVEEMLTSMIMIPGCGEFVYDTEIRHKVHRNEEGIALHQKTINGHNGSSISDCMRSLEQLLQTCPNIKELGLVVCWFGDSLEIGKCSIFPAVEYNDNNVDSSICWQVAGRTRVNARLISCDGINPNYGGSVNDASLVNYLKELQSRGLKVMLYPMFLMDLPGKPWRGHVSGLAKNVQGFFHKSDGYNNFILHYARLCKGLLEGFVIGSELKGITHIKDSANNFPAVSELKNLAIKVKSILGSTVKITYAADWSEYHHAEGGWFALDELWSCAAIDFVGIDAYVPLSNSAKSDIAEEEIKKGWGCGQGFDYYLAQDGSQQSLEPDYAWKNFYHWWSSYHTNPDGSQTSWQPSMKKIWFTEFGDRKSFV